MGKLKIYVHFYKPTYFGRWSPESFIQKQKDKQKGWRHVFVSGTLKYFMITLK